MPSCIRAPPEADTTTSALWAAAARSTDRVIFSPNHGAHAAADELEFYRGEFHGQAVHGSARAHYRIAQAGLFAHRRQPGGIRLAVAEGEGIRRIQPGILFHPSWVEQEFHPPPRGDLVVVPALGANAEIFLKVFLPDNLAALFALKPQPFRAHMACFLLGRRNLHFAL